MRTRGGGRFHALILFLVFGFVAARLDPAAPQPAEPALELADESGELRRLQDYRGKIVVLNFWATWCSPCLAEMPIFVQADKRFADHGVAVLAASLDSEETAQKIPDFVKRFKIKFPVLMGASAEHLERFGLGESLPATVFIAPQGQVAFRISGQAHRKEVFKRIQWMLGDTTAEMPEPMLNNADR